MGKVDKVKELADEAADLEAKLQIFYNVLDGMIAMSGSDINEMIEQLDVALPYLAERIKTAGAIAERLYGEN